MTALEMCEQHPATTRLNQPEPCDTVLGPDHTPCPDLALWLVRDWGLPGIPKYRACTWHAVCLLLDIRLCGDDQCGARGLSCDHPLIDPEVAA